MPLIHSNFLNWVIFSIFLTSCIGGKNNEPQAIVTPTGTQGSGEVLVSPTITNRFIPTKTPPPCNPLSVDYCIEVGTFYFHLPIASPGVITVDRSYPYGSTSDGTRSPHTGVEFYNASGTPVYASLEGFVFYSGDDTSTIFGSSPNYYGNLVVIQHDLPGFTIFTLYGHLSSIDVSIGEFITTGRKIGEVGASGVALGSHLHFEVRLDPYDIKSTVNPELWLIPLPGTGVLSMRFTDNLGNFLPVQPNIQYYPDRSGTFISAWQPEPYAAELAVESNWENVAIGNLVAGQYRITYIWDGNLYEKWVEIQASKLSRLANLLP